MISFVIFVIVAAVLWVLMNWVLKQLNIPANVIRIANIIFIVIVVLMLLGSFIGWFPRPVW